MLAIPAATFSPAWPWSEIGCNSIVWVEPPISTLAQIEGAGPWGHRDHQGPQYWPGERLSGAEMTEIPASRSHII
jgi:hypothetical protein